MAEKDDKTHTDECKCSGTDARSGNHKTWSDLADEAKQEMDSGKEVDADKQSRMRDQAGA